ncbi:MAG: flagellar protein FlaG, partial [Thioalkalispiraceae bacterium]
ELSASPVQQASEVKESREARDKKELDEAVSNVRGFVQSIQRDLDFVVDEETGKDVIKVIDQQTNEIIRQFPAEAILSLAKNLQKVAGLLLKTEV